MGRLDFDDYCLKIAAVVGERSTCRRHHMGAIAVRDKHILSTGYNGAATGLPDCLELGCLRDELAIPSGERAEICRAIHAEQNVIIQAALHGVSLEGATIYCTHSPCVLCAKMLTNSRIARFVSFSVYKDDSFREMFAASGIEIEVRARPPDLIEFRD